MPSPRPIARCNGPVGDLRSRAAGQGGSVAAVAVVRGAAPVARPRVNPRLGQRIGKPTQVAASSGTIAEPRLQPRASYEQRRHCEAGATRPTKQSGAEGTDLVWVRWRAQRARRSNLARNDGPPRRPD